uniref:Uncharacterized protein LOC114343644 n=1 Tax=Diabrotica virgifera virgifera TaxID=50390 RepID=A0A6P7GW63_DIAVI
MLPKMFKLSYILLAVYTFSVCESFENSGKYFQTLDENLARDATTNKPKDIVLFHNRRNGKSEIVIIVSFSDSNHLEWFISVDNNINKIWSWEFDNLVNHFNYFKMSNRNILFVVTNIGQGFLYEFNFREDPLERW